MSQEVSTDKATWQASMATIIRIHQCRGLCLRFLHIIDHMNACVMCWLSVLYGLFHYVASPSGVPLAVSSPCGVSRHPPSAQPHVVPWRDESLREFDMFGLYCGESGTGFDSTSPSSVGSWSQASRHT